jgi:hypothetical protein
VNDALAILIYLALALIPQQQPFDLQAELNALQPGDTLTIPPGVYTGAYVSSVSCTPAQPCRIEASGAIIDGGLRIDGSDQTWIGLEVMRSDWSTRVLTTTIADPTRHGINIFGARTKIINCAVHDTAEGIDAWITAVDAEIYGCLIYNNGWKDSTGKGRGHALYIQNDQGTKRIRNNIILPGYSGYGIHAYGSAGKLTGFLFEGNTHVNQTWLVGGGQPVDRTTLDGNIVWGSTIDLGLWGNTTNKAITVTNNLIASTLLMSGFQSARVEDNTFTWMSDQARLSAPGAYLWDENTYHCQYATCPIQFNASVNAQTWQATTGRDGASSFLYGAKLNKTIVLPNEYDSTRSAVVIMNQSGAASVVAPVSGTYTNAQNPAESVTLTKGAPLSMTGWTAATPIGATAPLRAHTFPYFGVFQVVTP